MLLNFVRKFRKKKEFVNNCAQQERQWSLNQSSTADEFYCHPLQTLTRVLKELCNCKSPSCRLSVLGVKYDLVCRLMEYKTKRTLKLPCQFMEMGDHQVIKGLLEIQMPISGPALDRRERLYRGKDKLWLRIKDFKQNSETTENTIALSNMVNSVVCRI